MNWNQDKSQFGNKSMDGGGSGGGGFGSPGGFMANTSFDSQSMSQDKQKSRKNLSMVPVTVALIQNATYDNVEDVCELDGIKLHQVTFVGLICEVQENTTHLAYEIDDLTGGRITVKRWIDKEDNIEEFNQSQFREDTYVRVYGYIKMQDGDKKTIVAFSITRVVDFNEITYHMLSVVHARLKLKEAPVVDNSVIPATSAGGQNMQFGTSFSGGQGRFGQSTESAGMSKTHSQVLQIISGTNSTEGMGIDEIRQKMRGISDADIREAVEVLSNEGHIYSTIDDDHFRSTND